MTNVILLIGFSLIFFSSIAFGFSYFKFDKPEVIEMRAKPVASKFNMQKMYQDVNKMERKVGRKLPERTKVIKLLRIGQEKYGVPYKDMLAIMAIESGFKKYAKHRNRDRSLDYGLTQQNSRYIKKRYRAATAHLKRYGIPHKRIYHKYDIGLNLMSAILFQRDIRRQTRNYRRIIVSYNTGMAGYYKYKAKGNKYFKRFMKYRRII